MSASVVQSQSSADIQKRFERLAREWKEKSRFLSNTAQMALLRPYQAIIGMGMPAVALILQELQREPDQWFWALEAITEENPVRAEDRGNVRRMAVAWIEWGKKSRSSHAMIGDAASAKLNPSRHSIL
jgi:hypothetical protein